MNKVIVDYINYGMLCFRNIFPTPMHVMSHALFCNGNGLREFRDGFFTGMLDHHNFDFEAVRQQQILQSEEQKERDLREYGSRSEAIKKIVEENHKDTLFNLRIAEYWNWKGSDIVELTGYMFDSNDQEYVQRMRGRALQSKDPNRFLMLCDGFPSAFPYTQFEGVEAYRYVPVAMLAKAGIDKDLDNFTLQFINALLVKYEIKMLKEENAEYREYMQECLSSLEEFRLWYIKNAVIVNVENN